eukprot:896553-Pleurochrysis_carterae.AAC.1
MTQHACGAEIKHASWEMNTPTRERAAEARKEGKARRKREAQEARVGSAEAGAEEVAADGMAPSAAAPAAAGGEARGRGRQRRE